MIPTSDPLGTLGLPQIRCVPMTYPQTLLGRDMFAPYWGVVLLGFVAETCPLQYPADVQLREFAIKRSDDIDRFLDILRRRTGIHDEIVNVARDEAPWASDAALTERQLSCDVSMLVNRWVEMSQVTDDLFEILETGAANATDRFIPAFAASVFSFGDRGYPLQDSINEVIGALVAIAGEDSIPGMSVKRHGYAYWCEHDVPLELAHPDTDPAYKTWLAAQTL